MKTYFWDFFGPRAQGTAEHFSKHLQQFLDSQKLVGAVVGVTSAGEGHVAAYCSAPEAVQSPLEKGLRPNRCVPGAL